MKKMIATLLALSLSLSLLLSLPVLAMGEAAEDFGGVTLNVYNWGEYIDEGMEVVRSFERKYNCRVNYKTYESNEILFTQLEAGDSNWDILVPSDYMIERLIARNMLQPLDRAIVTPELLETLTPGVRNLLCDPTNTYCVPYLWQSVGIAYDKTKIDPAVVEEKGWEIFRDPAYAGHTDMYDSERDAFMIAFKALGYSANTENEEEIQAAYEWLLSMNEAVEPFYVTDEVIEDMAQGYKWLGLVYSGDAAYVQTVNENIGFCAPKQGTNIAVDAMVIPANSKNPRLANLFIAHVMEHDQALAISEDVGYASPNAEVLAELSGPGGTYEGNEAYLPRAGYEKDEFFHDSPVLQARLSELWIKVMSAK